ncbi:hypothetical protein BKA56DRAFT_23796 [Ilyonectria sp. MPI-CAGE-AT-0026]|nr:hypothetical protein BKA56DRAFT_23796 [Ilyonectria sp. MPI-CAGE-AT-0026]
MSLAPTAPKLPEGRPRIPIWPRSVFVIHDAQPCPCSPIPPSHTWGRFEMAISMLPLPYGSRCSLTGRVSPRLASEWHAAPYLTSSHHFTHPDFPFPVSRFPFPVSLFRLPPPMPFPLSWACLIPVQPLPEPPLFPFFSPGLPSHGRGPSGCHEQSLMCIHASGILHSAFCSASSRSKRHRSTDSLHVLGLPRPHQVHTPLVSPQHLLLLKDLLVWISPHISDIVLSLISRHFFFFFFFLHRLASGFQVCHPESLFFSPSFFPASFKLLPAVNACVLTNTHPAGPI